MLAGHPNPSGDGSPPTGGALVPFALLLFVLASITFCNWVLLDATPYNSDQIGIATMLLKYRHPELFPAEQGLRPIDLYPRAYLGLLNLPVAATGEIKLAFLVLGTALLFLFAAGVYVLVCDATGNRWVAATLAAAALWFRASFEGHHWQSCTFDAFLPRLITLAIVPWLLIGCGRWFGQWKLVGVFAALGIAANYHPLSSLFLAATFGLTLLLAPGARLRHVAILAVSVFVFSAAAAPYFLETNRAIRAAVAARRTSDTPQPTPDQIEQVRQATTYGAFPPPAKTIRWVGFHLALPVVAGMFGLWQRRRRLGQRDRTVVAFLGAVLLVSIVGAVTETILRYALGIHHSFMLLRAFHVVYLPLYVFSGWLIVDLWDQQKRWRRPAAAIIALLLLVPASGPEYAVRWMKYKGKIPQRQSFEQDADFLIVCHWARNDTRLADTFVVPPQWNLFPFLAQRSMVASAKELSFIVLEPAVGVTTYERCRNVQEAYENPSPARLYEVARQYGARYILVRDREIPGRVVFQSGPYRVYAVETFAATDLF